MGFADLVELADRATQEHLGGVTVEYQPEAPAEGPAPDSVTVQGIFDERYELAQQSEAGVERRMPAVFVRLDDLPTDPREDNPTLTIGGKSYKIRERQPDGVGGGMRLLLRRVD